MPDLTELKRIAARRALDEIQDGMIVGLGSGSTTTLFIDQLGKHLHAGRVRDIVGVPTSESTAAQARTLGIPLTSLAAAGAIDVAVDGADEVDPAFNLIKGLGKALLREKIVEIHARHFVVIVDETKLSPQLGMSSPLPVELTPFAVEATLRWINTLGCRAELWFDNTGAPYITDNGNYLARCGFSDGIADPHQLARALADRPGVVEHGLFLGMTDTLIVAGTGGVRVLPCPPEQRSAARL